MVCLLVLDGADTTRYLTFSIRKTHFSLLVIKMDLDLRIDCNSLGTVLRRYLYYDENIL
jgi:hypothetical protein